MEIHQLLTLRSLRTAVVCGKHNFQMWRNLEPKYIWKKKKKEKKTNIKKKQPKINRFREDK